MTWVCDPSQTAAILNWHQGAGPLFVQSLQAILAAQCAIAGDHLWPPDATEAIVKDPHFDFIVVGAGSAGSVVANRLSEIPNWKVLLIEAGGDPTLATETPQLLYNNFGTSSDWQYKSEPDTRSCRGYVNNRCAWPRGKVLGGSSSINGMFYIRGNRQDYNEWAANGNKGWSYEEILPYFKKSENYSGDLTEELRNYHGKGGYLNVETEPGIDVFEDILIQVNNELGIKSVSDLNCDSQMGVAKSGMTTQDGVRHSTARAFLSPIRNRTNLYVMKNAYVTKILFRTDSNIANGVVINKNVKEIIVKANKEVIISAGTINTPQLLLLSGIGPSQHLQDMNIHVNADLPVGENLQDHLFVPFFFTLPGDKRMSSIENITKAFASYLITRKGPVSDISPHRIISFHNTINPSAAVPDVQFHHLVFPPSMENIVDYLGKHGFNDEVQTKFRKLNEDNYVIVVYSILLRPKSKGRIILKSTDPHEYPLIFANYFDDPEDLETIKRGANHILKYEGTNVFKKVGLKLEWLDLNECRNYVKGSDDFIDCYSRMMTISLYHPVGTAKMGPDGEEGAVVDHELKVRKVDRLRVIDASIIPDIIRGNTNAPTIMIAEKGADLVKKTWKNKHTEL